MTMNGGMMQEGIVGEEHHSTSSALSPHQSAEIITTWRLIQTLIMGLTWLA